MTTGIRIHKLSASPPKCGDDCKLSVIYRLIAEIKDNRSNLEKFAETGDVSLLNETLFAHLANAEKSRLFCEACEHALDKFKWTNDEFLRCGLVCFVDHILRCCLQCCEPHGLDSLHGYVVENICSAASDDPLDVY